MKKLITLLLIATMIMSITIVAYAASQKATFSNGTYSLKSIISTNYNVFAKDTGTGKTENITGNVANMDSRPCVYVAALDKNGYVINSDIVWNSKTEIQKTVSESCKQFRVRSFLMDPVKNLYRLSGSFLYQ